MFEVLSEKWPEILDFFKSEYDVSDVSFKTWILPLEIKSVEDGLVTLVFTGPSESQGLKYINKKYLSFLKVSICESLDEDLDLQIILPNGEMDNSIATTNESKAQLLDRIKDSNLSEKFTFDSFVVGSNNNAAQVTALAVAESPGETYNPLYIYGGVGLGKTHLLQAIGNFVLEQNPEATVLYTYSESFVNEVIDLLAGKHTVQEDIQRFRNKYRNVDVLLLDDIQFFSNKDRCQEELFNIFNDLHMKHKQIVITSDKIPKDMEGISERLINRFEMGLTVDIQNPDYETRMAILLNKAKQEPEIEIDNAALDFIANNFISNVRELEGSFNKLVAYAKMKPGTVIDLDFAKDILKDMIDPNNKKNITCESIIEIVAEHFDLTTKDLISDKRSADIAWPRQICMYLCRYFTDDKLETIAKALNKTHGNVIYGIDKVKAAIESDPNTRATVEVLKKKVDPE